ncbi:FAD/FMN-containing dehydrogenase [Motilibacter rhizosphaerae]|uniref:FAD/FMN-containing dehydrogenase n=1 Tax=Motilibacter rhizosphaerae TaxID=598652 RepID=A0A4Q7NBB9_9ACTN|nr:FAD-binding oxidoreductase [Motilibacter rhizosphaerae]RZS80120.1 FAD/FMN-containing dehydrogenase [Motilibacter rhizosphaerae]
MLVLAVDEDEEHAVQTISVTNWFGSITSSPQVVVEVQSVDEIVAVMKDKERYPSPVRAVGSNHSTTPCGVAEGGTLLVMRKMDRIVEIRDDTVTAQAGALYLDVNLELAKRGLQFFVNVELGNLTIGSACTGGTKDASMEGEFGQVASYAMVLKMVTPDGELVEIDGSDPDLLQVARSSYGLFGVVYEATFRVRRLAALDVHHERFTLEEFAAALPALRESGAGMMLYINPFKDLITVELRRYGEPTPARELSTWQWRLRDAVWSHYAPLFGHRVTTMVPSRRLRGMLIDGYNRLISAALTNLVRGKHTLPQAQQIRYPEVSGSSRYTFSIWAFPEDRYIDCLTRYFEFTKEHYRRTGYRVDLMSVGYRILSDRSSLFSYSYDGTIITFDPVSTGSEGWEQFLREYNELCSQMGGVPLFNQTNFLTRPQVDKAFGERVARFEGYRRRFDPEDRLLNAYFRELLASPAGGTVPTQPGTQRDASIDLAGKRVRL